MTDGVLAADRYDGNRKPTRPALLTLEIDQRRLIGTAKDQAGEESLRDGFTDRREIIHWYQRAIVRTFGYIASDLPPIDLDRDATLISNLITGPRRDQWVGEPWPAEKARQYRSWVESEFVIPACNRAFNDLRKLAGEYIDSGERDFTEDDLDPARQANVAMRPAFSQKDVEQDAALRELWNGFDTEAEVVEWAHSLNQSTNGAIAEIAQSDPEKDAPWPTCLTMDPIAIDALTGNFRDEDAMRDYREGIAVAFLLPGFVQGIKHLNAGELARKTPSHDPIPQG